MSRTENGAGSVGGGGLYIPLCAQSCAIIHSKFLGFKVTSPPGFNLCIFYLCTLMLTRYRSNQYPFLLNLIPIHPPLGKSNRALLFWIYTSALPQFPADNINPAHINVQTITILALDCRWEFPEECSIYELWNSF